MNYQALVPYQDVFIIDVLEREVEVPDDVHAESLKIIREEYRWMTTEDWTHVLVRALIPFEYLGV